VGAAALVDALLADAGMGLAAVGLVTAGLLIMRARAGSAPRAAWVGLGAALIARSSAMGAAERTVVLAGLAEGADGRWLAGGEGTGLLSRCETTVQTASAASAASAHTQPDQVRRERV
jgi:hypothetical protein